MMAIKENMVSIWAGNFSSNEDLLAYTTETYDEDGNALPSLFCEEFFEGEEPYEYDNLERSVRSFSSDNLKELLQGYSYDASIIEVLENKTLKERYNALILIYDFVYAKEQNDGKNVNFICSTPYCKDVRICW